MNPSDFLEALYSPTATDAEVLIAAGKVFAAKGEGYDAALHEMKLRKPELHQQFVSQIDLAQESQE